MKYLVDESAEYRLIDGVAKEFAMLTGVPVDIQEMLTQRVRHTGWERTERRSVGGSCHLMKTLDDEWVAINLARREDHELLGIFFDGVSISGGKIDVDSLKSEVGKVVAKSLVDYAIDTGLPIARLGEIDNVFAGDQLPLDIEYFPAKSNVAQPTRLQVVDLSSLWAGPLCSQLLHRSGYDVTKVESIRRPDGARRGHPEFFSELDDGKSHCSIDFDSPQGLEQLRQLLEQADIVIEGSRPRALQQLGFRAESIVGEHRPLVWLSITGYGRLGTNGQRVGFGDDCAVAGGFVDMTDSGPQFFGDAVADPITGLVSALAIVRAVKEPNACVISVSLGKTAAWLNSVRKRPQSQRD